MLPNTGMENRTDKDVGQQVNRHHKTYDTPTSMKTNLFIGERIPG
jgi:hypothetical protein